METNRLRARRPQATSELTRVCARTLTSVLTWPGSMGLSRLQMTSYTRTTGLSMVGRPPTWTRQVTWARVTRINSEPCSAISLPRMQRGSWIKRTLMMASELPRKTTLRFKVKSSKKAALIPRNRWTKPKQSPLHTKHTKRQGLQCLPTLVTLRLTKSRRWTLRLRTWTRPATTLSLEASKNGTEGSLISLLISSIPYRDEFLNKSQIKFVAWN